ncbi:hypothetical protein D3C78_683410 [compost metagenome]
MDEGLVLQQLILVLLGKHRAGTQADARRTGDGLGRQVWVEHNANPFRAEEMVELRLHPVGQFLGTDIGHRRRDVLAVE